VVQYLDSFQALRYTNPKEDNMNESMIDHIYIMTSKRRDGSVNSIVYVLLVLEHSFTSSLFFPNHSTLDLGSCNYLVKSMFNLTT